MSVDLSHLIPKLSNWPISQCKTAYTKIGLMYRCQDKSTTSPYHLQKESSGSFTFFHLFLVRCCIIIIVLYTIIQYIILGWYCRILFFKCCIFFQSFSFPTSDSILQHFKYRTLDPVWMVRQNMIKDIFSRPKVFFQECEVQFW